MKQKTLAEMSALIAAYEKRTGSKKEFCSAHQIAAHTLDYWRRKLRSTESSTVSIGNFVAVEIEPPRLELNYELIFPNGNRLKTPADLPVAILQQLVKISC